MITSTPLDREGEKAYKPSFKSAMQPKSCGSSADTALHARNFLDGVKPRAKCNRDIEIGHRSTSATVIANIALSGMGSDGKAERAPNKLS